jgi:hypothetical protein
VGIGTSSMPAWIVGWEICADSPFKGQDVHKNSQPSSDVLEQSSILVPTRQNIGQASEERRGDHCDAMVRFHRE